MSIKQHYQTSIAQLGYQQDPEQERAIDHFQRLYTELLAQPSKRGVFNRLLNRSQPSCRGLYLWGGPGRGKTYLMDLFYHHLPTQKKQRLHFHQFMRNVHAELATIGHQKAPLAIIGKRVAQQTQVLCLDEFYVADIGDAMLLAGLLKALFDNNVVLITTSNTTPDNLYRNGLQRDRFLPAIALIKRHTELISMDQGDDFRLQLPPQNNHKRYQLCDEAAAFELVAAQYLRLTGQVFERKSLSLQINGRPIPLLAEAHDIAWFEFDSLCMTARSSSDYLEIASRYRCVLITHIPLLDEALDNAAIRFIHLIDALYDGKVELITTAAAPPQKLYCGLHHASSFKRTASRLCEMEYYHYSDN